jgi:deoxyribodipyrimidine photo-lyase
MEIAVFWFRRDLRLQDNIGWWHANNSGKAVIPLFIFDENILNQLDRNDARVAFIHAQLLKLYRELGHFKIEMGTPLEIWKKLIKSVPVTAVYTNKDYEPYAIKRDLEITALLEENGIEVHHFKDQVIFEESEILKADGNPYKVFTPYKNAWLKKFSREQFIPKPRPKEHIYPVNSSFPTLMDIGFTSADHEVLDYSLSILDNYSVDRDIPSVSGTSNLGPHLRFGTVGIREIIQKLANKDEVFLSELIWREFFKQILFHYPAVVNNNFKAKYDAVVWRNNQDEFEKWCEGKTGYPMVDAGMRELNESGYMHNRVRMICAGFLCKHLLIDWRWGEAYFASKLLDYDLSANNGNWQWAAGTGCDAAPYFRIFNPIQQLKKFDPEMKYIQQWIGDFNTENYPDPIVDHKLARNRALDVYKKALQ